jgi:hypothetical protein
MRHCEKEGMIDKSVRHIRLSCVLERGVLSWKRACMDGGYRRGVSDRIEWELLDWKCHELGKGTQGYVSELLSSIRNAAGVEKHRCSSYIAYGAFGIATCSFQDLRAPKLSFGLLMLSICLLDQSRGYLVAVCISLLITVRSCDEARTNKGLISACLQRTYPIINRSGVCW